MKEPWPIVPALASRHQLHDRLPLLRRCPKLAQPKRLRPHQSNMSIEHRCDDGPTLPEGPTSEPDGMRIVRRHESPLFIHAEPLTSV
jgi:hypothetical protein